MFKTSASSATGTLYRGARLAAATLAVGVLAAAFAAAAERPIVVKDAWLRATPKSAPVAGGYVTLTNTGSKPDTLVSASLPIAPEGQIHTMTMRGGVMEMRRLDKGLVLAPGATVTLKPGGDHLMFMEPTRQLKEGETINGTLTFAGAGTVPVTFAVGGMAAKAAPGKATPKDVGGMDMGGMDMKGMHAH